MTDTDDRVPVQGEGLYWLSDSDLKQRGLRAHKPGSVSRQEFIAAYDAYVVKYGRNQSADRLIERGGFSFFELIALLGHEPETFEPLSDKRRSTVCPICGVDERSVMIASSCECVVKR
mgnify:FL=1